MTLFRGGRPRDDGRSDPAAGPPTETGHPLAMSLRHSSGRINICVPDRRHTEEVPAELHTRSRRSRCRNRSPGPLEKPDLGKFAVGRYYDPSTDQFISIDPDVEETGQPYVYTGDDPLNATDPLGLQGSAGLVAEQAWNKATAAFAAYCAKTHNRGTRVVHGAHCGQHWYQSESLGVAADVIGGAACAVGAAATLTAAGWICVAAGVASGSVHELQDQANKCGAGKRIYDAVNGFMSSAMGAFGAAARGAMDSAPLIQKAILHAGTDVPTQVVSQLPISCH